jgi:hypothetical protein
MLVVGEEWQCMQKKTAVVIGVGNFQPLEARVQLLGQCTWTWTPFRGTWLLKMLILGRFLEHKRM